jgi:hypothetical protein
MCDLVASLDVRQRPTRAPLSVTGVAQWGTSGHTAEWTSPGCPVDELAPLKVFDLRDRQAYLARRAAALSNVGSVGNCAQAPAVADS